MWGCLSLSIACLGAQIDSGDLDQLNIDPETGISEDDLLLLDDLWTLPQAWTPDLFSDLARLSFLPAEDLESLQLTIEKQPQQIPDFAQLDLAPETIHVLNKINFRSPESPVLPISLSQKTEALNGIRYRWRWSADVAWGKVGGLLNRNPAQQDLLDIYSWYATGDVRNGEWIIGYYQVETGLGLILEKPFGDRKGFSTVSSGLRLGRGIKPHRSSLTSTALRGAAWQGQSKRATFGLGFNLSSVDKDFVQDYLFVDKVGHIFLDTLTDKAQFKQQDLWGFYQRSFTRGLLGVANTFSTWRSSKSNRISDVNLSIYGQWSQPNWQVVGEWARGWHQSQGAMVAIQGQLPELRWIVLGRNYPRVFHSLRGNPLAEWTGADRHESGLFHGLRWKWNRHQWIIFGDLYADSHHPDYSFPIQGYDGGWQYLWQHRRGWLRIQNSRSRRNIDAINFDPEIKPVTEEIRRTGKLIATLRFPANWRWKATLITVQAENAVGRHQGIGYNMNVTGDLWESTRVQFDFVHVNTDGFPARVYLWDVNLPGEMRSRMYTRTAQSIAVLIRYRESSRWEIALRSRWIWRPSIQHLSRPDRQYAALRIAMVLNSINSAPP